MQYSQKEQATAERAACPRQVSDHAALEGGHPVSFDARRFYRKGSTRREQGEPWQYIKVKRSEVILLRKL